MEGGGGVDTHSQEKTKPQRDHVTMAAQRDKDRYTSHGTHRTPALSL